MSEKIILTELERLHHGPNQTLAVLFVHGLGGDKLETWRHPTAEVADCWPHWLGKDSNVDVWSVGYDATLSAWKEPAMALPDQADQIADLISSEARLENRRLLLVGHSMGGLVAKTLLVNGLTKGDKRARAVAEQIVGIVFIATPHAGSQLASLARAARWILRTNEQVGNLSLHDAHLRGMHQQFSNAVNERGLRVRSYAERQGVSIGPSWIPHWLQGVFPRILVVDPTSADARLSEFTTVPLSGDHFSICKPKNRQEQIHLSVLNFIKEAASELEVNPGDEKTQGIPPQYIPTPPMQMYTKLDTSEDGRLQGADDKRLTPHDGLFYGRADEVEAVLKFLRGGNDAATVTAMVAGAGGVGKTEVCKAALKLCIRGNPEFVAYYVEIPDRASLGDFTSVLSRATQLNELKTFSDLLPHLPHGLYYLDNLEGLAESAEGQQALRALKDLPGIRILASSRVSLTAIMGNPIIIGALPDEAAVRIFRQLWTGREALPSDAQLRSFIVDQLGLHALTITLTARLGDCFSYAELVRRWSVHGAQTASDPQNSESREGSLSFSLRLTAEALKVHDATLELWTAAALFGSGVPEQVLRQIELIGEWPEARTWLVRHNVISRRDERWHLLPPLARFALDAAISETDGFSWSAASTPVKSIFSDAILNADSIASTPQSLASRAWLLANFDTLHHLIIREISAGSADKKWLQESHDRLINQYQFRGVLSRELLAALLPHLSRPASALQSLGQLESLLGRPQEARDLYGRALKLYDQERSSIGQANTLQALGDLEGRLGNLNDARALYDRALALHEKHSDALGQANALRSLGNQEKQLGRPDSAREFYDRALKLYEIEQDGLGQANTLKALGDLERRLGELDDAKVLYDRALTLFEDEQDRQGQANVLKSLGDLESRLKGPRHALDLYDRALALHTEEQEGLGQANVLKSLGDAQLRLGNLDDAKIFYTRALTLYEKEQIGLGQANTLKAMGDFEVLQDNIAEARVFYDRAMILFERVQDNLGQANTFRSMGELERQDGGIDKARVLYGKALAIYQNEGLGLGQANTFKAMGDLEMQLDDPEKARHLYEMAHALYQKERDSLGQEITLKVLDSFFAAPRLDLDGEPIDTP